MDNMDIRWRQRFQNFSKALVLLNEAARLVSQPRLYDKEVEDLLNEGLIQRFEYTHELAWKGTKSSYLWQWPWAMIE